MAKVNLDPNFKEFLGLLNSEKAKYLLIGGYAVVYYGYYRSTKDLDIWIALDPENALILSQVFQKFGYSPAKVRPNIFLVKNEVNIFGREPLRIDVLTTPKGIDFEECYSRRRQVEWDGVPVSLISLEDLRIAKQASGRNKDLADLENLPTSYRVRQPKKTRRRR